MGQTRSGVCRGLYEQRVSTIIKKREGSKRSGYYLTEVMLTLTEVSLGPLPCLVQQQALSLQAKLVNNHRGS